MQWIDEMFVSLEKDLAAASAKRSEKVTKVDPTEYSKKQNPGALKTWNGLVSSIINDVNEFNNHKERAGQTPARISHRGFQCEVHTSGMHGKSLVLSLKNKDLQVSVHPEFPRQPLTIALELDGESQPVTWLLGELTEESARLSDQQLSEYLLKPVLSSAAIN